MLDWLRFPKTIFAAKKSLQDIKNYCFAFQIVTALVSIGYFIYALCTGTGLLWANALSLSLIVVFNIIRFTTREVPEKKSNRKTLKKVYRWIHILIKAFTLAVMLYGVYSAASTAMTNKFFAFTIIYASIMVMMWIIQLVLEVLIDLLDAKIDYISTEFQKDLEPIMEEHVGPVLNKVNAVVEVKERLEVKAEALSDKTHEVIDNIARPLKGFADSIKRKLESKNASTAEQLPESTESAEDVKLIVADTTAVEGEVQEN